MELDSSHRSSPELRPDRSWDASEKSWSSLLHSLLPARAPWLSDYVTELTFLLFLKMLAETGHEERLPKEHRWKHLLKREGIDLLEYYRQLLLGRRSLKRDRCISGQGRSAIAGREF